MSKQIQEPFNYIAELFDQHLSNQGSASEFDPSASFLDVLKNNKNQIISLNEVPVQQVPKNTLVRFRCMIQDTGLGQEMFISAYEKLDPNGNKKLHCYRYTDDSIEELMNNGIQNEYLCERSLVYCVSPPGENNWSRDAYNINSEELLISYVQTDPLISQMDKLEVKEDHSEIVSKKFPIPNDNQHTPVFIKFYNEMADQIKVGQLIEVIGIRGQDLKNDDSTEQGASEFDSVLNLFTNVPVLHAIAFNNLNGINSHPLLNEQQQDILYQAHDIRIRLIDYLSSVLGGDQLAAEFILLQLLSRVSVKNRGLKIGNFTLNVSGFPGYQYTEAEKKSPILFKLNNPASKALSDVLDNLLVHTVQLPLTIDGLNKTKFTPKSISENLEAGLLQLVDGTQLLVDETVLDEGQLIDPGVRNFQALNNLIQNQTLTYEFPYSQYDFDTDISVISLSTTKSMLPNHCSIQLETSYPIEDCNNENLVQPSKETLDLYRQFIHSAKYANYDISEEVSEYIQTSFVNERKVATDSKTELPTQEELMLRMNLARLAAVSFGETNLTQERYDYVVKLDKQRRARVTAAQQQQQQPAISK